MGSCPHPLGASKAGNGEGYGPCKAAAIGTAVVEVFGETLGHLAFPVLQYPDAFLPSS